MFVDTHDRETAALHFEVPWTFPVNTLPVSRPTESLQDGISFLTFLRILKKNG